MKHPVPRFTEFRKNPARGKNAKLGLKITVPDRQTLTYVCPPTGNRILENVMKFPKIRHIAFALIGCITTTIFL